MENLELLQIKSLAKNIRNDVMAICDETDDMSIRISVKLNTIINKLDYMLEVVAKMEEEKSGKRTKFKPKDKIWAIENINGKYFITGEFIVTDIKQDKNLGVIYKVDRLQRKWSFQFLEQDCFISKEEAQKECERRNGEE